MISVQDGCFNARISSIMERMNVKDMTNTDRILILIYSILPLCGHISVTRFSLFGVTLTPYRVLIPLLLFLFLVPRLEFDQGVVVKVYHGKQQVRFFYTLCFMFIYGVFSLVFSPYVSMHEGFLELFNMFLGILSIFIICEISLIKDGMRLLFSAFRAIICVFVLLGLFEIVTGIHLFTSRYADPIFLSNEGLESQTIHIATGLFYNENDFSAIISLFSPLFYLKKHSSYFQKLLSIVMLASTMFILKVNDSWICLFAVLVGFVYNLYIVKLKNRSRGWLFGVLVLFILAFWGKRIYLEVLYQFHAASQQRGSLYFRLNTYLVSIRETIVQTYGFGFGPGSFANVMAQLRNPNILINPHSLWVEIFTQYGVIVFASFVILLYSLFRRYYKQFLRQTKNDDLLASVLSMLIIYVLVAFSSSSWLKSLVMWLPIGLSLALNLSSENENTDHLGS